LTDDGQQGQAFVSRNLNARALKDQIASYASIGSDRDSCAIAIGDNVSKAA